MSDLDTCVSLLGCRTNTHRLGDLSNRCLFLTDLGAGKSEVRVLADGAPAESCQTTIVLSGRQPYHSLLPPCCVPAQPLCARRGEGMVSGVRSCKDANPSMSVEGPTFITSSKPNFPKGLISKCCHTVAIGLRHMNFGGGVGWRHKSACSETCVLCTA